MPSRLLVAGLDARSLILAAPVLGRERHLVDPKASGRDLLEDLESQGADLVVLGTQLSDLSIDEVIQRIRSSPRMRRVSVIAIVPANEPPHWDQDARLAGANAVLRRPLDEKHLETWLAKLLAVSRRVEARIPVQGHVVGTVMPATGVHFYGVTRNLSANGMLLASPVLLPEAPDLELEFSLPDAGALRALGRVVREAKEVSWPYLGYGVEFLFLPLESQEAIERLVRNGVPTAVNDANFGIHSTLRRREWIYEILEPVRHQSGWQAEIRRGPREAWRPGASGPFYVVEAISREGVLEEARAFLRRHGSGPAR